jgi:transmembrane sensor
MSMAAFDDRTLSSDTLEQQAWVWLRLLTSGQASNRDAERFRRWVRSSPAHQAAYNDVKLRWDSVKSEAATLLRVAPEVADYHAKTKRGQGTQRGMNRRVFLGMAAGAAAATAGVAIAFPPLGLWPAPAEWNADYRTAIGEQRTFTMADSVDVTLNTQTSVRRQMIGDKTVGLDLVAGEAAIDLHGNGASFTVAASTGRSVAESGQFEVRYLDDRVCVSCITGAVRVEHPAGSRLLGERQQIVYDARAISAAAAVDPAAASAWRSGILLFDQTRLVDAVAEINRYRPGRVVLLNRAMNDRTVSGRFPIKRLDLALWQLQRALGLQSESLLGGVLILT